jgi:hypothetical protein
MSITANIVRNIQAERLLYNIQKYLVNCDEQGDDERNIILESKFRSTILFLFSEGYLDELTKTNLDKCLKSLQLPNREVKKLEEVTSVNYAKNAVSIAPQDDTSETDTLKQITKLTNNTLVSQRIAGIEVEVEQPSERKVDDAESGRKIQQLLHDQKVISNSYPILSL